MFPPKNFNLREMLEVLLGSEGKRKIREEVRGYIL
jgi:hypothetical protein